MLEAGLVLQMRRNHPWVRLRRQVIGTGRYIIVVVIVASRLPYEVTGPFMLMGRAILLSNHDDQHHCEGRSDQEGGLTYWYLPKVSRMSPDENS